MNESSKSESPTWFSVICVACFGGILVLLLFKIISLLLPV